MDVSESRGGDVARIVRHPCQSQAALAASCGEPDKRGVRNLFLSAQRVPNLPVTHERVKVEVAMWHESSGIHAKAKQPSPPPAARIRSELPTTHPPLPSPASMPTSGKRRILAARAASMPQISPHRAASRGAFIASPLWT